MVIDMIDKVALRTTYIKNVKFKIIKARTGCQYVLFVGYFYYSENLNWVAQNLRQGHGLNIGGLELGLHVLLLQVCLTSQRPRATFLTVL